MQDLDLSNSVLTMLKQLFANSFPYPFENFFAVVVITSVTVIIAAKLLLRAYSKKLPPLSDSGMIETVQILMGGKTAPHFYLSTMKKKGLVFRLPLPERSPWIVVCDPTLARKILIEEDEKPALYSRFSGVTNGVPTVFSAPTHSHSWPSARKGIAPSFSMTNIVLSLPKMYEKINELKKILTRHESEKTTIDLPELMTQLTMDFICAGKFSSFWSKVLLYCNPTDKNFMMRLLFSHAAMFGIDHQTMQSSTSPGSLMLREFDIALTEFAQKHVYNPIRFLMFWNKELIRGKAAAATIEKSQQDLVNKYRSEKSPEEIEKDQSILGHLVRSPYVSDKERCADMTTLMIAGHDTTSYTLAWILLEISRHPAVLTKLKKEIDSVVGDGEEHISQRHLNSMVYLDQVIKEGLRLWPVTGLGIMRQNSKEIEYGDYTIPKGSIIQLCTFVLFRVGIQVAQGMS